MRTATSLLVLLAACETTVPLDPDAPAATNTIEGPVIVSVGDAPANAIVLVASADNPLPPNGTGRPVGLTTVPAARFATDAGVQSADFALTGLADGDYLLSGLLDLDDDFHPAIDAMGGATCGDIVGGHIASLTDPTFTAVSVAGGERQTGIAVTLAQSLPVERPAFYPLDAQGEPGPAAVSVADAVAGTPQGFALLSTAVHAAIPAADGSTALSYDLDGPYVDDPERPVEGNPTGAPPSALFDLFAPTCDTAFLVQFLDDDADGAPDPHPLIPGVYNSWPQIGLTWLGAPTDTDADGAIDSFDKGDLAAETWTAPAVLSPTLLAAGAPVGVPLLTTQLPVVWVPVGQRSAASDEASCEGVFSGGICTETVQDPAALPRGAWAITVIESTGQTWTVPNALSGALSTDSTAYEPRLQGTFLVVQ